MSAARVGLCALAAVGCGDGSEGGAAIFVVAVDGAPGGALLSAWVEPGTAHRVWLAGGFVGVAPGAAPDGRARRLVRYDGGTLTTVCTTDRALWWGHGVRDGALR